MMMPFAFRSMPGWSAFINCAYPTSKGTIVIRHEESNADYFYVVYAVSSPCVGFANSLFCIFLEERAESAQRVSKLHILQFPHKKFAHSTS
jgi:hypothetical protein